LRATHGKTSDTPTSPNFWFETTIDNYLRARASRARCGPPSNATWRWVMHEIHCRNGTLVISEDDDDGDRIIASDAIHRL